MYKIKSPMLVIIAILVCGVLSSATAQRKLKPSPIIPPLPPQVLSGAYKISVMADQLSPGLQVPGTKDISGWTCYGTTDGDLSGFIFISMNSSTPEQSPFGGEIAPVTGGSWSKLIFIKGQYAGSVYGQIVSGNLVSTSGEIAAEVSTITTISLQLTAEGGTGNYVDNVGSGSFEGVLDRGHKTANVSGTLVLNY